MAKGKYRISQPRRSKKVLMKQIAAQRWKILARIETASKGIVAARVAGTDDMALGISDDSIMSFTCNYNDQSNSLSSECASPCDNVNILTNASANDESETVSENDDQSNPLWSECASPCILMNASANDESEAVSENEDDSESDSCSGNDDTLNNESQNHSLQSDNEIADSSADTDLEELYCETEKIVENPLEISGRRLINISYFLSQLKALKHKGFDCSFFDMTLISEKMEGLQSIFSFRCEVCNIVQAVRTENPNENINTNSLAVLGAISMGIGYSQLSELFAAMDIPNMSNKTYSKFHDKISTAISHENEELMKAAGEEEAKLAIESGDVNQEGIPVISVIVDGAWSKRSYRTNYNASSGVACIIGAKTKKLLYVGIRNKYCYVCARGNDVQHYCFKNWNSSSTSMEAHIIVEGFKKSVDTHRLIYGRVIGDGDSSVYRKLTEVAPYGPTFVIEKIECRNHLLRNYLNKIAEISKDTKFPIVLRKKVTNGDTLGRFRNAVTKAIEHRKKGSESFSVKASLLKNDIVNGPKHIFGDHSGCADYFCKKDKEGQENIVPDLQISGLLDVIKNINKRLANNAGSLLHDMDTNAAETYNSIVAKFVGGKRLNFSLRGSYETRCKAAGISYNTDGNFECMVLDRLGSNGTCGIHLERFLDRKRKAREFRRNGKSTKKKGFAAADEDYGSEACNHVADMDASLYATNSANFLHELEEVDREQIFQETVLQSSSEVWKAERRKRITASTFGKICKLRKTTSTAKTVASLLLYSTFLGTNATRFGLENEETAIKLFEEQSGKSVRRSGLIIDEEHAYLACSPDGLIDDNELIEIKSSDKSGNLPPVDAVVQKKIDFCKLENGLIHLKRNHNYFYQIQGLLHITKRDLCYFLVYTRGGLHIEEIKRDDTFWKENMERRLCDFYISCLLPELVDSRRCRQQEIRDIYLN